MSVDPNVIARVLGIETTYLDQRGVAANKLPQRIAILAQGRFDVAYSLAKRTLTGGAQEAGDTYGYGSPIHLVAREFFPDNGDGVSPIEVTVYPLDDDYDDVPAVHRISLSGTQAVAKAYRARIGGYLSESFTFLTTDSLEVRHQKVAAAINAVLHMPVIAYEYGGTRVDLVAKWSGLTGNDIVVEIIGETDSDTVFAISQPTAAVSNPTVDSALALIGTKWETMLLNGLGADVTALNTIQTWGEGRWGETMHKPAIAFYGDRNTAVASAIAVPDARPTDYTNCQLVGVGSPNLPFVIAARQLVRIAKTANSNPARDYGSLKATGLIAGEDGDQWDHPTRDIAVKGGSSTIEVRDGVVTLSDIVTPYAPSGQPFPAYRHVCDIVKLQQLVYNLALKFNSEEWDGAPLIPDSQVTTNETAKKPRAAITAANNILQALGDDAILADVAASKKLTTCLIDENNPKRINLAVYPKVSGNTNIKDIRILWGFNYQSA